MADSANPHSQPPHPHGHGHKHHGSTASEFGPKILPAASPHETAHTDEAIEEGTVHIIAGQQAQADDINVTLVAQVGVFAAVLLFIIICGLEAWFYIWSGEEVMEKTQPSTALLDLRAKQMDDLKGTAPNTMPISQAMDQVLAQYMAKTGQH